MATTTTFISIKYFQRKTFDRRQRRPNKASESRTSDSNSFSRSHRLSSRLPKTENRHGSTVNITFEDDDGDAIVVQSSPLPSSRPVWHNSPSQLEEHEVRAQKKRKRSSPSFQNPANMKHHLYSPRGPVKKSEINTPTAPHNPGLILEYTLQDEGEPEAPVMKVREGKTETCTDLASPSSGSGFFDAIAD